MYDPDFMRRAIALSAQALTRPGTEPFGAVVVRDGRIVGEGINLSLQNLDPTSHGETEAIRDACRNLGTLDLADCEIYTSCEPCAMCVAAMTIAGISRMYYAASMDQAGAAFSGLDAGARHPIDVEALKSECAAPVGGRRLPAEQAMAEEAAEILRAWAAARRTA